jgi:hypothetical protein
LPSIIKVDQIQSDTGNIAVSGNVTFSAPGYLTVPSLTLSSPLAVAAGGSGAATLTGILVGQGTSAFTTVTAPSGTVVGTSDTQTLTNKTITNPAYTHQTLTDGSTINWNTDSGSVATVTLGGNRTMAAPTNLKRGTYILEVIQDGTGSLYSRLGEGYSILLL